MIEICCHCIWKLPTEDNHWLESLEMKHASSSACQAFLCNFLSTIKEIFETVERNGSGPTAEVHAIVNL